MPVQTFSIMWSFPFISLCCISLLINTVFDFSQTFRGVNTDFFFNFSDIFLISPTSDPSDFLLNRAVRAVAAAKIWVHFDL
jgi:hypothetical protein